MILNQIKIDALNARKGRLVESGVLSTLLGECDTKCKSFNPARDLTDEEVRSVVQKFLKNNTESRNLVVRLPLERQNLEFSKLEKEKTALEAYLPKQMTQDQVRNFIQSKISIGLNSVGALMGALKQECSGQYDGRMASILVKEMLG